MDENIPQKVGLWQVRCEESDHEWDYVAITKEGESLTVHDRNVGRYDIGLYHASLTNVEWRFIV